MLHGHGKGLERFLEKFNICFSLRVLQVCMFLHECGYPGLNVIPLRWHLFLWHEDEWN